MILRYIPPHLRRLILAAAVGAGLQAGEKFDLDRITPVPASETIPVQDFFRPSLFYGPQLNPSGTRLSALVSAAEDRDRLIVYELDSKKMETVYGSGDRDIYAPVWLDDNRLVFSLAKEKHLGEGIFAANVGSLDRSFPLVQFCAVYLVGIPEKNRLRPLYWIRYDLPDGKDRGVYAINTSVNTGGMINLRGAEASQDWSMYMEVQKRNERHFAGGYPIPEGGIGAGYMADKDGELAFGFTAQDGIETLHRFVDGSWKKCPVNLDEIDIVDSGEKPGQLVVRGPRQPGKPRALQFMDADTGQLGEVLLADSGYDFSGWLYRHPVTHDIVGLHMRTAGPQTIWFTEAYRSFQKILNGYFPGKIVQIIDYNKTETRFLVEVHSDQQPAIYYWVDFDKHTLGLVKNSTPWIDPARMRPMNVMKFKTRDGRKLDAYVTLPSGASKQHPAPLVVLSHGGPYARDVWGFNPEAQFLASRGYAVMQPNYRGSPGYDWMFPGKDRYNFRKMSDDVTDATKAVLASGLVDPKRVAIMGGSFGGYLAISGIVNEPELYRCAITIAGIFDWGRVVQDEKYYQYDSPSFGWMIRELGDPKKQKEYFDSISPVRHVEKIRVPVFVAHGKDDPVADISESRRLISELKEHNVPHEVMFAGGEGHGFGHLGNQVELYTRIEAFLAKNLAPADAAVASAR